MTIKVNDRVTSKGGYNSAEGVAIGTFNDMVWVAWDADPKWPGTYKQNELIVIQPDVIKYVNVYENTAYVHRTIESAQDVTSDRHILIEVNHTKKTAKVVL